MANARGLSGGDAPSRIPACSALTGLDAAPGAADVSPAAEPAATSFGDYDLLEPIAQGGMGAVYRARQRGIDRVVALKMILAGRFASDAEVQRFRTEARAAGALDHPHIVPVYDVGEHEGRHYFTMKLVAGGSLAGRLRDFAADPKTAAALLAQVARAIHHAHQHGVLHRDLKPSNILLDAHGLPYVTDFGLARRLDDDSGLTVSEAVLGTPCYMAPELAAGGAKQATVAADVYGLGAILYELLTGHPPFQADTRLETLRRVQEQEPSSVRSANRKVGRDLETVCLKCLSKDPRQRYASAEALADDLERWLAGKSIHARRASAAERTWRWSRRHPAAAALVAVVLVAVAALGVGGFWHTIRLQQALDETRQENARARAVTAFLQDVLELASPERAEGRKLTIEEALDEASRLAGERFAGQPLTEAEVRTIIGSVYRELGKDSSAARQHRKAMDIRLAWRGEHHADTLTSRHLLGESLWAQGHALRARVHVQKAYDGRNRDLGPEHRDTLSSLDLLATTFLDREQYREAEPLHQRVLAIRQRTLGPSHPHTLRVMANLARDVAGLNRHLEAEWLFRTALEGLRRDPGAGSRDAPMVMINFAETLEALNRHDEAEQFLRDALATRTRLLTREHISTQHAMFHLGRFLLRRKGEGLLEAQRVFEELLEIEKGTTGERYGDVYNARTYLADVLDERGDKAGALSMRLKMMERSRQRRPAPPPLTARAAIESVGWHELLEKVVLREHVVRGKWRATGGGLAVEPMLYARLALPVEVKGSFELKVTFTRTDGDGSVEVILPGGSGSAVLVISARHGRYHLLRNIWQKGLTDNVTARPGHLENNRHYVLHVSVKLDADNARIVASLDGTPCIAPWEGPQAALIEPPQFSLPAGARLAIGSNGRIIFHSVKLLPLDGEARWVEFDPALWKDPWPYVDEP